MAGIQRHDNDDPEHDDDVSRLRPQHTRQHDDDIVDELNDILDLIHQFDDDYVVYVNHPDIGDHLDHLIVHPYDHDYYYDPIHHFITRRHNDAAIAAQFNDDLRPFLNDTDTDTDTDTAEDPVT